MFFFSNQRPLASTFNWNIVVSRKPASYTWAVDCRLHKINCCFCYGDFEKPQLLVPNLKLCPPPHHPFLCLPDCGELHLHSKEPFISSGAGDDAVSTDGWTRAGRLPGQGVAQQRGGVQLLGYEKEEEEERLAGRLGGCTYFYCMFIISILFPEENISVCNRLYKMSQTVCLFCVVYIKLFI